MELLSELTSKLGVNEDQAKGLAGGVLGMIQGGVEKQVGAEEAQQLSDSVPELEDWKAHVPESDEGQGGLMGLASGVLGGDAAGGLGALTALAGKFNLDGGGVQALIPIVTNFLRSRLDDSLLSKVLGAVPFLGGGGAASGIAGAVGKLFG